MITDDTITSLKHTLCEHKSSILFKMQLGITIGQKYTVTLSTAVLVIMIKHSQQGMNFLCVDVIYNTSVLKRNLR